MRNALLLIALLFGTTLNATTDAIVVKRRLAANIEQALPSLNLNQAHPYRDGFVRDGDQFICDNGSDGSAHRGVCWSIALNQTNAAPVVASAWAKSESTRGADIGNFSLYLDVIYADGTPLWGQKSSFNSSTNLGWQRREVIITPDKPIRSLTYYLLFRGHAGRVRFKEPRFGLLEDSTILRFDATAVEQVRPPTAGFLLRDVAQVGDFVALQKEALGVRLNAQTVTTTPDYTLYDVTLQSLTEADRALTLVYTLPQKLGKLSWLHNLRKSLELDDKLNEAIYATTHSVGANGLLSRFPFGAITLDNQGVAIGLDPTTPLVYRIACQPVTRELYLACDIGLTKEKPTAQFRFCTFHFSTENGFRSALAQYYQIFPDAFVTRIKEQGVWMPFAPISKVEGWQDFGFRFKEGTDETVWDDANNILTFRYTEPMTWWMKLEGSNERTLELGATKARQLAQQGNSRAKSWLTSAFEDFDGHTPGAIKNTPWCNGVVWSMNGAPGIKGDFTEFKSKWSSKIIEQLYGAERKGDLDGEYIDSAEAYVTAALDYRRENFAAMERPLSFDHATRKVGIFKGMIGFEYVRAIERDIRKLGHYMMANSTPHAWFWLAPLLDIMGTETNWKSGTQWRPMTDEELLYRRALCKGKPYCFLMNTNFENFTYQDTEKFMRHSLAYGMFPGFFSADASTGHYFKNPTLYNRDRPLFKKYIPLCKKVAEAGWEPLTGATSDNPEITIERFGNQPGACYLTIFNLAAQEQTATISLTNLKAPNQTLELTGTTNLQWQSGKLTLKLAPQDVRVMVL